MGVSKKWSTLIDKSHIKSIMVKLALCSVVVMALGCQMALAAPSAESAENQQVGTCHTEDYIRCALVIAGCTATCGSDYTCLVNCVINKHYADCVDCIRPHHQLPAQGLQKHQEVEGSNCVGHYCPGRCCSHCNGHGGCSFYCC